MQNKLDFEITYVPTKNSLEITVNFKEEWNKPEKYNISIINITDGNNEKIFEVDNVTTFPVVFRSELTGQKYSIVVSGFLNGKVVTKEKKAETIFVPIEKISFKSGATSTTIKIGEGVKTSNISDVFSEKNIIIEPANASNQNLDGGNREIFKREIFNGERQILSWVREVISPTSTPVASVDSKGYVLGIRNGTASLRTFPADDRDNFGDVFSTIYVAQQVEKITTNIKGNAYTIQEGEYFNIETSTIPKRVYLSDVSFKVTSGIGNISVDETGMVKALSPGKGEIEVKSVDNPEQKVYISVEVLPKEEKIFYNVKTTEEFLEKNTVNKILHNENFLLDKLQKYIDQKQDEQYSTSSSELPPYTEVNEEYYVFKSESDYLKNNFANSTLEARFENVRSIRTPFEKPVWISWKNHKDYELMWKTESNPGLDRITGKYFSMSIKKWFVCKVLEVNGVEVGADRGQGFLAFNYNSRFYPTKASNIATLKFYRPPDYAEEYQYIDVSRIAEKDEMSRVLYDTRRPFLNLKYISSVDLVKTKYNPTDRDWNKLTENMNLIKMESDTW